MGDLFISPQPPLFKIKKGKEIFYAYSDEERDKILGKDAPNIEDLISDESDEQTMSEDTSEAGEEEVDDTKGPKRPAKITVQRYKGLGEMNADELKETTMDINNRVLLQVNIEDASEADKVFDVLMGTDVPSRKSFIQSNAKEATIDV